jgi:hypothetical protein
MIGRKISKPSYLTGLPPGKWEFYQWTGGSGIGAVCINRNIPPMNISYDPEGGLMGDMNDYQRLAFGKEVEMKFCKGDEWLSN